MLAAILQSAGYRTGLYTSPHLKDFRERIRINGGPISQQQVVAFVEPNRPWLDEIQPSFFELTVALAFLHFAVNQVDVAVIEVGLGGRLDSTNIINPQLSIITNIGIDHRDLLGDTLELIAGEKAGIIKKGIPVLIGERQTETDAVFMDRAERCQATIYFAPDHYQVKIKSTFPLTLSINQGGQTIWEELKVQLGGPYQHKNVVTVLKAVDVLNEIGYSIAPQQVRQGLEQVIDLTGIKGRWQILGENPMIICDTGHNRSALECLVAELNRINSNQLHMVLGFVKDKEIDSMLAILPKDAKYYFCEANIPRSLDAEALCNQAQRYQLSGEVIPDPNKALKAARAVAASDDLIYVGGSTFVVAELTELDEQA
jgi:dihydrofolate synthase/folylpolyglutamate synthase